MVGTTWLRAIYLIKMEQVASSQGHDEVPVRLTRDGNSVERKHF